MVLLILWACCLVDSCKLVAAVRTACVAVQPPACTLLVEVVRAGQDQHLLVRVYLDHANGAHCLGRLTHPVPLLDCGAGQAGVGLSQRLVELVEAVEHANVRLAQQVLNLAVGEEIWGLAPVSEASTQELELSHSCISEAVCCQAAKAPFLEFIERLHLVLLRFKAEFVEDRGPVAKLRAELLAGGNGVSEGVFPRQLTEKFASRM
mmetsp:Transcript_17548/g.41324  ORF Transcript_17548/g.41324 Transcript_17548/m.41324 type:complete len:206 (-) Transcript_17548:915-1532(-)